MPNHASLDLVATLRRRRTDAPVEQLDSREAVRQWLIDHALVVATCTDADAVALRDLREHIAALVTAAALDSTPDPAALAAVNAAAGQDLPRQPLIWDPDSGFHRTDSELTAAQARTALARDTVELLTGPDRARLHRCEADTCGTVFLLPSGGRPRRWCSSATCGNRERVRTHRATQR